MGILVDGRWEEKPVISRNEKGGFERKESVFRNWITKDGSSGYLAEPNRYHIYVSYACPWACRTLIFRKLKGLEEAVSFSVVEPFMEDRGWEFGSSENKTSDEINNLNYLYEIYLKADANYTGRVSVPVLWDKKTETVVNNESSEIIRMLNSEFNEFAKNTCDFYPEELRKEIDEINELVYDNINNGVYKTGFAGTQEAYEEAFDALFKALDHIEERLAQHRYLVGDRLTEADWRLFVTLIRFDAVYVGHFKCNLKRIDDYENLSNYLRDLYQVPGIKETVNFEHIKEHYYRSHPQINPTRIVPKGPSLDYDRPHNRKEKF